MDLTDPGTLAMAVAFAAIALAVVGGVVGFALWYSGDQDSL
jgi:hypothetical protein